MTMKAEKFVKQLIEILQKEYDHLQKYSGCLCGHFESCSNCDGTNTNRRKFLNNIISSCNFHVVNNKIITK